MIRLTAVIEMDGQAPRALTHESNSRSIILGRDAAADFQIPLSTISRRHARIFSDEAVFLIEDLGSTHGTLLNGKKLTAGDKRVLRDGDMIELTKARITCAIESEKVAANDGEEGTQAIAARAVKGILGRLGEERTSGPFLRVLNGPDEGTRFPLSGGTITEWTLGRSKTAECVLNDANVSRRHAVIKKDWNGYIITDLGSKNGVVVNDARIKKQRRLRDRDEIVIGPIKLVFIDPDADLMAALSDVPGFEMQGVDDESDVAVPAIEGEPSHIGAPGDGEAGGGDATSAKGATAAVGDLDGLDVDIDPELLEPSKLKFPVEWVVIGVVGVLILAASVVLVAILA